MPLLFNTSLTRRATNNKSTHSSTSSRNARMKETHNCTEEVSPWNIPHLANQTLHRSLRTGHLCLIFCLTAWTFVFVDHFVSRQPSYLHLELDEEISVPRLGRREVLLSTPCQTGIISLHGPSEGGKLRRDHPRTTCLTGGCVVTDRFMKHLDNGTDCFLVDSIPTAFTFNEYSGDSREEHKPFSAHDEMYECTLADPLYENLSDLTPPTCNDVHSMGLAFTSLDGLSGGVGEKEVSLKFLNQGGYNSVWKHESLHDRLILKMHRPSRKFSDKDIDRNRRDVLISGRAGRSPDQYDNNVLPMYQYCGYTLVVPLAIAPLDEYVSNYRENHNGNLMGAAEMFHLAFQAARGLYQAHLYLDGQATMAHSDVKPSQFLLFDSSGIQSSSQPDVKFPLVQLNDFNRCRLLYRSPDNKTCPFRMCGVTHKGSKYRSPEEYMECADQKDSIDVFSLGGVFYYLLSDGLDPYYEISEFDSAVERILEGKFPRLPSIKRYEGHDDKIAGFAKKRDTHPAFLALQKIMLKCWKFKPTDRPSSLEVLQMFESMAPTVLK